MFENDATELDWQAYLQSSNGSWSEVAFQVAC
jgi:hypothetical protein